MSQSSQTLSVGERQVLPFDGSDRWIPDRKDRVHFISFLGTMLQSLVWSSKAAYQIILKQWLKMTFFISSFIILQLGQGLVGSACLSSIWHCLNGSSEEAQQRLEGLLPTWR